MVDPDVLQVGTPIKLDASDVLTIDNSLGASNLTLRCQRRGVGHGNVRQITVLRFQRGRFRGSEYSEVGVPVGGTLPAVAPTFQFSYETEEAILLSASGAQIMADDLDATFPAAVPLSAIQETTLTPPAGHVWRIESIHNPASAALAGAIEMYSDQVEGVLLFEKALAAVDTEYLSAPIELPAVGQILVDVTAAGAANTALLISGKRVA